MRPSTTFVTLDTSAATAWSIFFAPVGQAAPNTNAGATIAGLESQGYDVTVDRIGDGPINTCVVTSVRNPRDITRLIKVYYGPRDKNGKRHFHLVEVLVRRTIQVSLNCT